MANSVTLDTPRAVEHVHRRGRTTGAAVTRSVAFWTTLAGAALMPVGLALIMLAWYGASRTPFEVEQNSYLISGGLFGLGLVVTGAVLFLGGALAGLTQQQREDTDRIVAAVERIGDGGGTMSTRLVATPTGTLAHRPTCAAVGGRHDLVAADLTSGRYAPCRLCQPGD